MRILKLNNEDVKNLIRILLFALLGGFAWWGITPLLQFFMFVPLLFIQKDKKGEGVMKWWIAALILWNLNSIWWVAKATIIGPIAATFVTTTLFGLLLSIYNRVWKKATLPLSYSVLVAGWIAGEWFYTHNTEISFPWINLGNAFGITPMFVQWYEYTGALGGSLWVLVVNLLIFEAIKDCKGINLFDENGKIALNFQGIRQILNKKMILPILIIITPIILSIVRYNSYSLEGESVKVAVLQPNIDPYTEKFGSFSQEKQLNLLLSLADRAEPRSIDFFVAPETAIDDNIWLHTINNSMSVEEIQKFLYNKQPQANFVTGAVTREYYPKSKYKEEPTFTARTTEKSSFYYDAYNSSLSVTVEDVDVYHKSRLTIGVEMMPFYRYTKRLGELFVDLGGTFGMYGSQKEREVFINKKREVAAGSAICYESVYGYFFREFIEKGAEVMFVITNDGWWGDTPGYKQHLSFSSLRAIETRREIARSANTGISAIIDSRGVIKEKTGWDEESVIISELTCNNEITPYVKYGDYIGRLSFYIFVLSLLYFVSYIYKRRSHLI